MKVVELSGGVGGARMAKGLAAVPTIDLTVVVNVGDDEDIHGLHVSADLDTVVYTLAGVEGPDGWGRSADTFMFNDELARFGVDNRFRLGDLDLALNLFRTEALAAGKSLSAITAEIANSFDIRADVLPATDDWLRTEVKVGRGEWISFQEYFVFRANQDEVEELRFTGSEAAHPAPGVLDAIGAADIIVIAPSNPPLSIWPILAIDEIRQAITSHQRVVAVSPLFGGKALRGPADRVMASLGLTAGNAGVMEAYAGVIDTLVVDTQDADDAKRLDGVAVIVTNTRIKEAARARELAEEILSR
ncbi:MAG: 2-phospho-L-lactate transferase [Actinobacteria bacterium]|nr:2-phospho-L-lactate transferase [Actinomycetota bacterium]